MKKYLPLIVLFAHINANAQTPGGVSANLTWWIKSDAGITQSSGIVSQWNDQSATAIHVSATGSQQPVNNQVLFNYYPVVSFDSTDDALRSTIGISANAFFTLTTGTSTVSTGSMFVVSRVYYPVNKNIVSQYPNPGAGNYAIRMTASATNDLQIGGRSPLTGTIALVNNQKPFIATALETDGANLALHYKDGGNLQTTTNSSILIGASNQQMRIGNSMGGDIAEIITYNVKLTDAQRIKIESYLALKYGITLTNTGGGTIGDYVSSGGTTIWDASDNSSYHNNVIGIGSDATNSGLSQKQSRQWDDSTRIYVNTLAANNAANGGSITNGQFVMMGNNAARMYNNAANAEIPSGFNIINRFDREWKITNTTFTGAFSIDIKPEAGTYDAGNIRVLIDADGNFNDATIIYPTVTYSGGVITISGISNAMIASGTTRYLTLATVAAPGNISSNLALWLKADAGAYSNAGTTLATNNGTVRQWNDFSANNRNLTQATSAARPVFLNGSASKFNYNPVLSFSNDYLVTNTGGTGIFPTGTYNDVSIYTVYLDPDIQNDFSFLYYQGHNSDDRISYSSGVEIAYFDIPQPNVISVSTTTNIPENTTNIVGLHAGTSGTYGEAGNMKKAIMVNGKQVAANNTYTAYTGYNSEFSLGANGVSSVEGYNYFIGHFAEMVVYQGSLSAAQRNQVESYLAIKYGKTLSNTAGGTDGDYFSSAGSTIWDASDGSGYHNNLIGIGRDDNSSLLQKQSHQADDSTRIYISTLSATNAGNAGTFSSDGQFIIMGNNNAPLRHSYTNIEYPTGQGIYSRLDREWKITNTNFTGTFSLDIKPNTSPITASDLRVLIDDDGNFTNATLYNPSISYSSGIISISGISNSLIPANSTKYLTVVSMNATTPLPVGLINFTAKPVANKYVQLDWQTVSEINSASFIIERSADGVQWNHLGTVNAAGNSSALLSYSYKDYNALNGVSYYRVKQTDIDGTYKISSVRNALIDLSSKNKLWIYPNPVINAVSVEGDEDLSSGISIYDATGRNAGSFIRTRNISKSHITIDMSNLPSGIYIIRTKSYYGKIQKQ